MRVASFLSQFESTDFDYLLVVDDGSGSDYDEVFKAIAEQTLFDVVRYETNMGKGHALKFGLKTLLNQHSDIEVVVTADSDGQHLRKDILAVRDTSLAHPDALTLGARDFTNAPPKSASGNLWSCRYFRIMTGAPIQDTQTGLRGIPSLLFDLFLRTHGNRFEFEMNFLFDAAKCARLEQITITTVYENGKNEGTHFRPVKDSMRIATSLIVYAICFLVFFLLDAVLFGCLYPFFHIGSDVVSSIGPLCALHAISLGSAMLITYFGLQIFAFFNKVKFYVSLPKTIGVLLGFYVIEVGASIGLLSIGWPVAGVHILVAFLLALLKCPLDYNWVFALKKIVKK